MIERVKTHNEKMAHAFCQHYPDNVNASILIGGIAEVSWMCWYDMCFNLAHELKGEDLFEDRVAALNRIIYADLWIYHLMNQSTGQDGKLSGECHDYLNN